MLLFVAGHPIKFEKREEEEEVLVEEAEEQGAQGQVHTLALAR